MNRRAFLGCAAVLSTAGCLDRIYGNDSPSSTDVDPEGGTFGEFNVSVNSEDASPLEYQVSIPNHTVYNDEPLQVEIQVENTSNTAVEVGDKRDAFFWFYTSNGFALYPSSELDASQNTEPAKDVATGIWYLDGSLIWEDVYQTQIIEGGETVTETLELLYRSNTGFPSTLPESMSFTANFNSIADGEGDVEISGWETEVSFSISS